MKSSLFLGLVLFALVPLVHGACWSQLLKYGATHCQDAVDKTWHPVGSEWTNSECSQCSCSTDSQRCCYGFYRASGGCFVKYNYETCTAELVITDPSVPCNGVGK